MAVTEVAEIAEVAQHEVAVLWQGVPARSRKVLTLGAAAGMVTGSLLLGMQSGPGAITGGATAGAVLGLGASGLLLALNRKPLLVMAALLAVAPLACILSALTGFAPLGLAPAALAALATAWLAVYPKGRAALTSDISTCAVIVYALLVAFGLRTIPLPLLLPLASGSLLPMSLFFAGMMLPALSATKRSSEGQIGSDQLLPHARVLRWLVSATLAGSFSLALLVVGLSRVLPAIAPALSAFTGGLPGVSAITAPLAHVLGLTLILLLTWDSRGVLWLTLLGRVRGPNDAASRNWPLPRRALFALVAFGAPLLLVELALVWSRSTLAAVGVALLWAALVRRRYGMLLLVALLALPVIAVVPYGSAGWLGTSPAAADAIFDGAAWQSALTTAISSPLGVGLSPSGLSSMTGTHYLLTLRTLGLPGLVAVLSVLLISFVRVWRARQRLRLLSVEAGAVVAAGALLLFVAIISLNSSPLTEPATAMLFWLFLGLANGIVGALENGTAPASVVRDYPLRIAYVLHGSEDGETPLALLDLLQALDRRHVTPLLVSLGQTTLIAQARNLQISSRVVALPDPDRARLALVWSVSRSKLLRWLAGNPLIFRVLGLGDRLLDARNALGQWIGIIRAVFDLRPDLIVSNSISTHLPALVAARLSGVPVTWHMRERAPAQLQPLLNALVPWTAGAITSSQAAARIFNLGLLAHLVRVVRPGVAPLEPLLPERRAELRRSLDIPENATVLVYPGLLTTVSGHLEVLQALLLLAKRHPRLHVVLAHEELPALEAPSDAIVGATPTQSRARQLEERLRQTLGTTDSRVTWIGACSDLGEVLSLSDVVVLPLTAAPSIRTLLLAMASGKPIVAARTDTVEEQLAGAWGYRLVASAKPEALSESIGEMLLNLDRYQAEARRNPGVIRDWYTSTLEAGRLVTVYRMLCIPPKLLERVQPFHRKQTRYPRGWHATLQQLTTDAEEALDA